MIRRNRAVIGGALTQTHRRNALADLCDERYAHTGSEQVETCLRYALVETGPGGDYVTTHASAENAAHYNATQEHAEDFTPVLLVDLDTGQRKRAIRTYDVEFHDPHDVVW